MIEVVDLRMRCVVIGEQLRLCAQCRVCKLRKLGDLCVDPPEVVVPDRIEARMSPAAGGVELGHRRCLECVHSECVQHVLVRGFGGFDLVPDVGLGIVDGRRERGCSRHGESNHHRDVRKGKSSADASHTNSSAESGETLSYQGSSTCRSVPTTF